MPQIARGLVGELRAGWQVAARLATWSLSTPDDRMGAGEWRCTATLLEASDYWLTHGGRLDLWLDVGRAWWVWHGVSPGRGATEIRGTGGPESVPK